MKSFTNIMHDKMVNEAVSDRIDPKVILIVLYKRYAEEVLQWYTYHIVSGFMVGKERPNIEKTFAEMANDICWGGTLPGMKVLSAEDVITIFYSCL